MDRILCLDRLSAVEGDSFSNVHAPWIPAWGRGLYGGVLIAQSLVAAQSTVHPDFDAHSLHSHFVRPASPVEPITYHVRRVRDGHNYVTRTVEAVQSVGCLFTATISFMRQLKSNKSVIGHANYRPADLQAPPVVLRDESKLSASTEQGIHRPCDVIRCGIEKGCPRSDVKLSHWIRARGLSHPSPEFPSSTSRKPCRWPSPTGYGAHLAAVAYMSDNYFIGTVSRVHRLPRFTNDDIIHGILSRFRGSREESQECQQYLTSLAREEATENGEVGVHSKVVRMMATLNHTIFFHNPRMFSAGEWMMAEMETPWAGNERGLVVQRIWSSGGVLIATCFQEGVVRLGQPSRTTRL